jgi:hypothetical protein
VRFGIEPVLTALPAGSGLALALALALALPR